MTPTGSSSALRVGRLEFMFGKFLKTVTWRAGKEIKNYIRIESQKLKPTKYT